jgi:hypothetical protein
MGGDGGRVAIHDDSADFSWFWAVEKCHAIMENVTLLWKKIHNRRATIFQMMTRLFESYL